MCKHRPGYLMFIKAQQPKWRAQSSALYCRKCGKPIEETTASANARGKLHRFVRWTYPTLLLAVLALARGIGIRVNLLFCCLLIIGFLLLVLLCDYLSYLGAKYQEVICQESNTACK